MTENPRPLQEKRETGKPRTRQRKVKYVQQLDGEWFKLTRPIHKLRCCDCGLVHIVSFRIKKLTIHMRAIRDNRATAASRSHIQ